MQGTGNREHTNTARAATQCHPARDTTPLYNVAFFLYVQTKSVFNIRKTRNWVQWIELCTSTVNTVSTSIGFFRNDIMPARASLFFLMLWQTCALGVTLILVIFWHSHVRQLRALAQVCLPVCLSVCLSVCPSYPVEPSLAPPQVECPTHTSRFALV